MSGSELQRRRVRVGAVEGRVLSAGPDARWEAVVFVHGNPGSCEDWAELVGAVGARQRAVALDLPDFGRTAAPAGFEHSVEGYAGYVEAALRELLIERVHLVLHDFGGPIGLAWATEHPDRLLSITLIDTGILPGYRWHRLARIWRTPLVGEAFQALATRTGFRALLARAEPRGLPLAFVDRMYDDYDRRTRRAVLRLYRSTPEPDAQADAVGERFAARELPALVIWGQHDRDLPVAYAARQRAAFPRAAVHVLPDSGHWPFADAPERVRELLLDFLGSQRAAAQREQVPQMTS